VLDRAARQAGSELEQNAPTVNCVTNRATKRRHLSTISKRGAAMTRQSALIPLCAFAAAALLAAPSLAADPARMIAGLGIELQSVVRTIPDERRPAEFRRIFEQDFDLPQIAQFVFGRSWQLGSPAQQLPVLASFENYLIASYGDRLVDYANRGETPIVTGSRHVPGGAIVSSEVVLGRNPTQGGRGVPLAPVTVDWRLVKEGGVYKIVDVIVDGVSMAVTKRLELADAIEREGGEPTAIVSVLRARSTGGAP
jgi:phospholipid transport system substrate-binding protein